MAGHSAEYTHTFQQVQYKIHDIIKILINKIISVHGAAYIMPRQLNDNATSNHNGLVVCAQCQLMGFNLKKLQTKKMSRIYTSCNFIIIKSMDEP